MAIKAASQQDTETAIFGAGIPSHFSWWHSFVRQGWELPEQYPYDAPNGWVWVVMAEDPEKDDAVIAKEIRHADIMRAARKITGKDFNANEVVKKQARFLLFNVEEHDIDAVVADAILQVAVFGEIVYG